MKNISFNEISNKQKNILMTSSLVKFQGKNSFQFLILNKLLFNFVIQSIIPIIDYRKIIVN